MAAAARPARADRLERMTNLVLVLLETPRPLSLREIAASVVGYPKGKEASRQAFERDKRALRELGIPISVEALAGEEQLGYRIHPEGYYLPELRLDPREERALNFAVAAVQLGGAAGRDAVAKLGATGEVPEPGLPPIAVLPSLPALGPLHEAVRDRALVHFGYRGRRREVEPYGLVFKLTAWYLVGRDRTAPDAGLRTFRVDRFEDAPVIGVPAAFELPDGFDLREAVRFLPWRVGAKPEGPRHEEAEEGEPAALEVTMTVDARLARSVVAMVGAGAVEAWEPSGAARLAFAVPEQSAFVDWVVGLGDTAEVLSPPDLRAAVVRRLEAVLACPRRETDPAELPPSSPSSPAVPALATSAYPEPAEPALAGDEPVVPRRPLPPPQATAGDRLNRLFAILVYLARVGEAPLAELSSRFSVSARELLHDLELVACCGVPPYTPDQLIDLLIDEDHVVAEGLRELAHPRRFTPEEGFALAAAARALLAVPGADEEGDLAGALAKLEVVLGSSSLAVEVDSSPALGPLQAAVASGEQVEIDYFGAAATEPSARVVDPYQVVVREGKWYLDAWCHNANGLRRFQLDRVRAVRPTGRPADVSSLTEVERESLSRPEAFLGASEAVMVRIEFPSEARFAVEGLVTNGLEELGDGRMVATIPVSDAEGWFGRLLLLLGPEAEVIDPPALAEAGRRAARRALSRYER
ncbi:MAG: helix-turn-helix transcriptional regulator [Acidimicrobiales bacterium]